MIKLLIIAVAILLSGSYLVSHAMASDKAGTIRHCPTEIETKA